MRSARCLDAKMDYPTFSTEVERTVYAFLFKPLGFVPAALAVGPFLSSDSGQSVTVTYV